MIKMDDADKRLKLLLLEIASREMLDDLGRIDINKLMTRTRQLYHSIYEFELFDWKPFVKNKKKEAIQPKIIDGKKICPGCGEVVSPEWTIHQYMSNGQKCGRKL